jgi:hypothetical protein
MKKIVSIMMVIVLVFTMAGVAFASTNVISPEKPNTDVEPGTPGSLHRRQGRLLVSSGSLLRRLLFLR